MWGLGFGVWVMKGDGWREEQERREIVKDHKATNSGRESSKWVTVVVVLS